jgi:hypothetical protein
LVNWKRDEGWISLIVIPFILFLLFLFLFFVFGLLLAFLPSPRLWARFLKFDLASLNCCLFLCFPKYFIISFSFF